MASKKMVKHVVLDSGAFIRNAPVKDIAEVAYTIPDVVKEIRDKPTKARLRVLPYELECKEPSQDALNIVTEFAKKTGDYRSLSAVDIRVMALTYQLEKQMKGTDHLKKAPEQKVAWQSSTRPLEKATEIAGFYLKKKKPVGSRTTSECSSIIDPTERRNDEVSDISKQDIILEKLSLESDSQTDNTETSEQSSKNKLNGTNENIADNTDKECDNENNLIKNTESSIGGSVGTDTDTSEKAADRLKDMNDMTEGDLVTAEQLEGVEVEEGSDEEEEEDDDEDDDDDDDDGWITPSNIKSIKRQMGGGDKEEVEVAVGCLTTDFAMQNVLIQIGLNVISVDGLLIKRAKSYVLRCHACMKITTNIQKVFCPHCGNQTLTKLSMTVNDDGSIRYFLSRRRPITGRGTRFSLPLPKGGKHADNPILVEDQPVPQNRAPRKALGTLDVFDPDYCAGSSPFTVNDVTSRASKLGIRKGHCWDKRNPNMKTKRGRGGRRK